MWTVAVGDNSEKSHSDTGSVKNFDDETPMVYINTFQGVHHHDKVKTETVLYLTFEVVFTSIVFIPST